MVVVSKNEEEPFKTGDSVLRMKKTAVLKFRQISIHNPYLIY